jgi:hypothetical protein
MLLETLAKWSQSIHVALTALGPPLLGQPLVGLGYEQR